jgi:hypothetical protein
VVTNTGHKPIGRIKVGDKVLSQDGRFHTVTASNAFPATKKPNLVDLKVHYRAGRNHELTLTSDHKVLVYRDGRNKWIPAGQLRISDQLYARIKTPHNKGQGITHACLNCKTVHRGQGESFCSMKCRDIYWSILGNNPHVGQKRSEASRGAMSVAAMRRFTESPFSHPNHLMAKTGYKTSIERQVEGWFKGLGVEYHHQFRIGKHWADFYVPAWHTIFECDGSYWHKDQARDIARDEQLIKAAPPELRIVHIHFFDPRHSPLLTQKPLRHVSYVAVNPNMNSYVNLETFKPTRLVSITPRTYERTPGHKSALLYDLTVEGMHSFFANGVLVSNSYVEFGTAPHIIRPVNAKVLANPKTGQIFGTLVHHPGTKANPFMERIIASAQPDINTLFGQALDKVTTAIASQANA